MTLTGPNAGDEFRRRIEEKRLLPLIGVYDVFSAKMSSEHNNANIIVIGARVTGKPLAREIVEAWLTTPFAGGRHQRRLDKITEIEESQCTND